MAPIAMFDAATFNFKSLNMLNKAYAVRPLDDDLRQLENKIRSEKAFHYAARYAVIDRVAAEEIEKVDALFCSNSNGELHAVILREGETLDDEEVRVATCIDWHKSYLGGGAQITFALGSAKDYEAALAQVQVQENDMYCVIKLHSFRCHAKRVVLPKHSGI
jgi:hypothetical protein